MEHFLDLTQSSYAHTGKDEHDFYSNDASNTFSNNHHQQDESESGTPYSGLELVNDPIYDSSQDTKDSAESDGRVTASKNSDGCSEEGTLFSDGTEVTDAETKANELEEEIDELLFEGQKCSFEMKDIYKSLHQTEENESSRQVIVESSSDLAVKLNSRISWIKLRILKFSEALSILLYIITIVVAAEDLGKGQLIADTMKDDPWNQVIMNDQSMNVFDLNNNVRILAIYIITLSVVQIFTTIFELPLLMQVIRNSPNSSIQKYAINIIIGILLNQLSHSGAVVAKYLMIFDALIFIVEYFGIDA
jgi:hypothetical protein